MAFNINFGQNVIANTQKDRQLDLEQQQINNQRVAQEASAANQASATFWNRVSQREANENRQKDLQLQEEKQSHDLSWDDAVKQQELAEREARTENLKKLSAKYDSAFDADKAKADEEVLQAKERQKLLNSELGTLYLSAYQRGGRVSPSQIQEFNKATGSQYDFIGNTMTIPMKDGTVRTEPIGDGKRFYMGQFQRDGKGDIVYGNDGTPVTQMIEMPAQMQRAILSSAYGKDYLGDTNRSGLTFADRLALEEAKNAGRSDVEKIRQDGETARAERGNASREKIAGMNNETKLNLANLTGEQKKELADAANALKKYGIDIGLQKAQEGNASREKIATAGNDSRERIEAKREAGRQARATLRDDQAWGKMAIEQQKVDNNFAVQMRKADTYGKRVDLIEQKIQNDYEIGLKNAKTAEERQKVESEYKARKADIEDGNLDLNWFKATTAVDQGQQKIDETTRHNQATEGLTKDRIEVLREKLNSKPGSIAPDRMKELNRQLDAALKVQAGGSPDARRKAREDIDRIEAELSKMDKANIKSSDNMSREEKIRKIRELRQQKGL